LKDLANEAQLKASPAQVSSAGNAITGAYLAKQIEIDNKQDDDAWQADARAQAEVARKAKQEVNAEIEADYQATAEVLRQVDETSEEQIRQQHEQTATMIREFEQEQTISALQSGQSREQTAQQEYTAKITFYQKLLDEGRITDQQLTDMDNQALIQKLQGMQKPARVLRGEHSPERNLAKPGCGYQFVFNPAGLADLHHEPATPHCAIDYRIRAFYRIGARSGGRYFKTGCAQIARYGGTHWHGDSAGQ